MFSADRSISSLCDAVLVNDAALTWILLAAEEVTDPGPAEDFEGELFERRPL